MVPLRHSSGNYLNSTVSHCTSAAQLTVVSGAETDHYGGIAGLNNGTLEYNLAIGATIPNDNMNPCGIIVSSNGGTLTQNYYSGCTFAGTPNATGKGKGMGKGDVAGQAEPGYLLTLAEGITSNALTVGSYTVAPSGQTVTLGHNRPGYVPSGYVSSDVTITDGAFTMPAKDISVSATWTDMFGMEDGADGSADHPYTISNADGWNYFCDALQNNATWNRFSGKTVKLGTDIGSAENPVTRMAGSSCHDFCGTFDGDKHTLTFNYGTSDSPINESNVAPFRNVEAGCIIKDLHVAGDIYTSGKYAAGIAGTQYGAVTISNCHVSTTIHSYTSGDGTHGGLVGQNGKANSSALTIEGCVFDGKLLTEGMTATSCCGGFVGWHNKTVTITDCLYAPATLGDSETEVIAGDSDPSATFSRNGATLTNSYYTRTLGTAQGLGYSFDTAPANIGTAGTAYSVSGITPYTRGLLYDGRYYMTPEAVSLSDNATNDVNGIDGYFADVTLTGRTLYKDGYWNTLCLPFAVSTTSGPLAGDNVQAMMLDAANSGLSSTTLTLNFTSATSIPAGTPFIIKWATPESPAENLVNPVFTGVTVSADAPTPVTFAGGKFVGSYAPVGFEKDDQTKLFLGSNNQLFWPDDEITMNAFRAYFDLGSNQARQFVLNFGDSEDTGIRSLTPNPSPKGEGSTQWYTLDGRKLDKQPTKPGLYIYKGKAVVIK